MTSNKFLDAQSHAFKEGVEAYWELNNMDNPYPKGTREHNDFEHGWQFGYNTDDGDEPL